MVIPIGIYLVVADNRYPGASGGRGLIRVHVREEEGEEEEERKKERMRERNLYISTSNE